MAAQALVNGVYGFDDITERASCIITIMSFCLIQVSLYRNSITGTSSNGHKKRWLFITKIWTGFHCNILSTFSEISQSLLLHPVSSLPSVQSRVPSQ